MKTYQPWRLLRFWLALVTSALGAKSFEAAICAAEPQSADNLRWELIAIGSVPGTAKDLSGFDGNYEEGTPCDQIGGFSAIDASGRKNRFWVLADRGPADGAASFQCRVHDFQLTVNTSKHELEIHLLATLPLLSQNRVPLLGLIPASAGDENLARKALDPEGLRLLSDGSFVISDEYGPAIDLFTPEGVLQRSWSLPSWMCRTRESNLQKASQGAMNNRGLEGLSLTSDRASVVAAMQGPLIQDSYLDGNKRYADYTRLIKLALDGQGQAKHWLYPLASAKCGISEILAVDTNRYLVLERDGEVRSEAKFKTIFLIDTRDATDVADRIRLDPKKLPSDVRAAHKLGAIDLLDPNLQIPKRFSLEKPEGLAWGDDLPDGRRTLIVCFDNDFKADQESLFLAFAIEIL